MNEKTKACRDFAIDLIDPHLDSDHLLEIIRYASLLLWADHAALQHKLTTLSNK